MGNENICARSCFKKYTVLLVVDYWFVFLQLIMINREEKSLRHVAMVAKLLIWMTTNRKRHLKDEFAQLQWLSILFKFISFGKCWQNFLGLNPKGPYLGLEEEIDNFCVVFTYSRKRSCGIMKFHIAGVQRRERNEQNSVMHLKICCFVNKNLLLVCRSPSVAVVFGFVVIQKFRAEKRNEHA